MADCYIQLQQCLSQGEIHRYTQFVLAYVLPSVINICELPLTVFICCLLPYLEWRDLSRLAQTCRFFYEVCWAYRSTTTHPRREFTVFNDKHSEDTLRFFLCARLSSVSLRITDTVLLRRVFVDLSNVPHCNSITRLRVEDITLSLEVLAAFSAFTQLEWLEIGKNCRFSDSPELCVVQRDATSSVFLRGVKRLKVSLLSYYPDHADLIKVLVMRALATGSAPRLVEFSAVVPDWNTGLDLIGAVHLRATWRGQDTLKRLSCHSYDLRVYIGGIVPGMASDLSGLDSLSLTTECTPARQYAAEFAVPAYLRNLKAYGYTLRTLKRLDISGPVLYTDDALAGILETCVTLVNLIANNVADGFGAKTFGVLARSNTLRSVALRHVVKVSADNFAQLSAASNLNRVYLQGASAETQAKMFYELLDGGFKAVHTLDVRCSQGRSYDDHMMSALMKRCSALKTLTY